METQTRLASRSKENSLFGTNCEFSNSKEASFRLLLSKVASCSALFHEAIKKAASRLKSISHHPRVREGGAKPPRYSLFIIMKGLLIVTILLLSTVSVNAAPFWLENKIDSLTLWFTPPSQKALLAANTALERVDSMSDNEEDALEQIYSVQELLTIIEQNIEIKGNPHKALRTQQEVERRLLLLQENINQKKEGTEQYNLVLLHASLRVSLLLKETELAKEKTRIKVNKDS